MPLYHIGTDNPLSTEDASRLGVSGLVHRAELGREPVLLRNDKPVAAVMGMERFEQLQRLEEDCSIFR